jgi:hypothetical protein
LEILGETITKEESAKLKEERRTKITTFLDKTKAKNPFSHDISSFFSTDLSGKSVRLGMIQ